jgi:hypothetical protein
MYRVIVLMFAAVLLSACSTKLNLSEYLPEWAGGQRSTAGWNSTMLANLLHSVVPAFVVLSQDLGPLGALPVRHDYEYERNGVANLFIVFAPLEGLIPLPPEPYKRKNRRKRRGRRH